MEAKKYTIGEVAQASGVPVRRIRFYADSGLLTPSGRTDGNYRLFTDSDIVRLDLISMLRTAGIGLDGIANMLGSRFSLEEVLRTRLAVLEEEIVAKKRVASVLRATLRSSAPTNDDLTRLWRVSSSSSSRVLTLVEHLVHEMSRGATVDENLRCQLSAKLMPPELPEDPTTEEIDAWNELIGMLQDSTFVQDFQGDVIRICRTEFKADEYKFAAQDAIKKAAAAIADGLLPSSPLGRGIAVEWFSRSAQAMHVQADQSHLRWLTECYQKHQHGRPARYQALLSILKRKPDDGLTAAAWRWLNQAVELLQT